MTTISSAAIRYFIAVSKAGSFRRTAQLLHVSASAINRQILLLEAELGVTLFERSRGRNVLRLTSAGEIFLSQARAATEALELAKSRIDALSGLRSGTISVGVPEMFVHHFLPGFLVDFRREFPGITFRVLVGTPNKLADLLVQDEIEIAIVYHPPLRRSIKVLAKIEQPNCIMVSTNHPLARLRAVRLAECVRFPLVMPEASTLARELYDRMLAGVDLEPSWVVTTDSYEMLRSMARAGLGVAIVSDYLVEENKPPGAVLVPLVDCPSAILACCARSGRDLSIAAWEFVARLRDAFEKLEAGRSQLPVRSRARRRA